MHVTNQKRRSVTAVFVIVFMMAFALSGGMFSTALPKIIETYNLSLEQASLFSVFQSGGMLLANCFTALVVDKLDKNKMLGVMFLLMGGFLFCIGSVPPFVLILMLFVLMGIVSNVVNNACSSYMSDLYGDQRARYISILHAFFGLGSLMGPLFIGQLTRMGFVWNNAYTTLGLVIIFISVAYFLTMMVIKRPVPEVQNIDDSGKRLKTPYKKMLRSPKMLSLCAVSFLYAGFQVYNTWLPTYLNNKNPDLFPISFCSTVVACFSVGMIVSRLINGYISKFISARNYITLVSICSSGVLVAGLLLDQKYLWPVVGFLLGLLTGAIYTAQFVMACEYFPRFSASATAFTGFSSAIGGMCFNALAGQVAQKVNFLAAMCIPVVALLITFLVLLTTKRVVERADSGEGDEPQAAQ